MYKRLVFARASHRGVSVPSIAALQTDFAWDRHFMLWDAKKSENMYIGLRSLLCLFTTRLKAMENPTELEVNHGLNHTFDRPAKIMERSPLMVSLKPDISGLKSVTVTMHLNSNPLPVDGRVNDTLSKSQEGATGPDNLFKYLSAEVCINRIRFFPSFARKEN
ncbi:hypothetical protein QL093DRAFT_2078283 [Fusarium oxysporum]|nr:hypothetical protein QL093DRAFT_2078283 [Fusarium oxysporum]